MTICKTLISIDWLGILQTAVAIFAAWTAYSALNTWREQTKAQRHSDYLDTLTDTVHEYIQSLNAPIQMLSFIHIGIESHKGYTLPSDSPPSKYANVIAYIERRGEEDSKKLWGYLNKNELVVAKIDSLVARGQIYGFKNFDTCRDSIRVLLWQSRRLQAVAAIVGSIHSNWEHPDVIKSIESLLAVKQTDIESHVQQSNIDYLSFVAENYRNIYPDA